MRREIVQKDGPLMVIRYTELRMSGRVVLGYALACEECPAFRKFAHRVDVEDAFDRHDHNGG